MKSHTPAFLESRRIELLEWIRKVRVCVCYLAQCCGLCTRFIVCVPACTLRGCLYMLMTAHSVRGCRASQLATDEQVCQNTHFHDFLRNDANVRLPPTSARLSWPWGFFVVVFPLSLSLSLSLSPSLPTSSSLHHPSGFAVAFAITRCSPRPTRRKQAPLAARKQVLALVLALVLVPVPLRRTGWKPSATMVHRLWCRMPRVASALV